MARRRKRSDWQDVHERRMKTDAGYRRLAERVDAGRTAAEREAFPLGSEEFSREVTRKLKETIARYEGRRRRASS
jgi:hypothetical protein